MDEVYVVLFDDGSIIGVASTRDKADKIVKDDIDNTGWSESEKMREWADYRNDNNSLWFVEKVPFEG
jgi:hypothetical protein